MKTICCGGWDNAPQHPPVVLADDGEPGPKVSHGICPACAEIVNRKLDTVEALSVAKAAEIQP